MVVTQMSFDPQFTTPLADGTDCTEDTLSSRNSGASAEEGKPNLINGKLLPRLSTAPGQVERWRLIYGGSPAEMGIKLHPALDAACAKWDITHTTEFVPIARDGITLPAFYRSDTMWVSPGYRIDAMVKMPAEKQTLCLVARRQPHQHGGVLRCPASRGRLGRGRGRTTNRGRRGERAADTATGIDEGGVTWPAASIF